MVSVIILGYNRAEEVIVTIQKLKEYELLLQFPLEIIVVDNASIDNTSELVKRNYPEVILVTKAINNGIAGWNDGFKVASYQYFLVLDDDSHIESGLPEAISFLQTEPTTGILALNITAGPYLTESWEWQNGKPWQDKEPVLGFFGCGAIIRKEVYDKIGGFAEWLSVYAHEWEYGIRCMDAGYIIRYFKNSSINHRASATNRSQKRMMVYGSRNELLIVYKFIDFPWKYIFRMCINNLKRVKNEGWLSGYYYLLGYKEFLKTRKTIKHTPVSKEVQEFFISNYMNTFPILRFIYRRLNGQTKKSRYGFGDSTIL